MIIITVLANQHKAAGRKSRLDVELHIIIIIFYTPGSKDPRG